MKRRSDGVICILLFAVIAAEVLVLSGLLSEREESRESLWQFDRLIEKAKLRNAPGSAN